VEQDTQAGEDAPRLDHGRPYTIVSDGNCKVCKRFVGVIAKWDTQDEIEVVTSQTPGVTERFPWIPAKAYLESIQLIENSSGRTWQGAAALEHTVDILPRGRLITWIFSIPFARPLAERLYRLFAMNRYRLGCGEHCSSRRPDL
jgi:predicted DCC family thiol-disulfide oxidoreductase YuxK